MLSLAIVKNAIFKFSNQLKIKKRKYEEKLYIHQNLVDTLGCYLMKAFCGRLRKAKVMSKKL